MVPTLNSASSGVSKPGSPAGTGLSPGSAPNRRATSAISVASFSASTATCCFSQETETT